MPVAKFYWASDLKLLAQQGIGAARYWRSVHEDAASGKEHRSRRIGPTIPGRANALRKASHPLKLHRCQDAVTGTPSWRPGTAKCRLGRMDSVPLAVAVGVIQGSPHQPSLPAGPNSHRFPHFIVTTNGYRIRRLLRHVVAQNGQTKLPPGVSGCVWMVWFVPGRLTKSSRWAEHVASGPEQQPSPGG